MNKDDLAIVIPVWNLPEDLTALLRQIAEMGIFSQVIISDDGSDLDCCPETIGISQQVIGAQLVYLRSDTQCGAGHARNIGMDAVTADNVIFFDADDRLCDDLSKIWQQHLDANSPDFTIFRHTDTRIEHAEGRRGTFQTEEAIWESALGQSLFKNLSLTERAELVLISAYPWNKIYRTDFLRKKQHNLLGNART